ncbi:putative transcriptional regulatory [Hyphodiscus hymeniophilus]|uniref:Transcriptional regulatory n=1 Tax=Hyphodiscus hymeniophilus TaxID=353542 RepID=A0A9P7AV03_9HELO|nr:putative transcriptional regulatory [Hyphodiscus hymeniophilus]
MRDAETNVSLTEELPTSPTNKPQSWSRNPRTSCDLCKQMKAWPVEGQEEESSSDKIESQAELSNHLSNLVLDPSGSPNFIGSASGFSMLSPQGMRWISEKIVDKDELAQLFQLTKRDFGAWGSADADLWYPMPRSKHSPLPSKDLALQYVNCFFITFNNVFPVVDQNLFNSYFELQYSTNPPASSAWYALLNAVLCLGSIRTKGEREWDLRGSCLIDYTSVTQEAGAEYFRNACHCFHDLFFKEGNLMAMQAITLMIYIATSSPNPQPSYVLTAAAGNLANTLGLHSSSGGFGLAPVEIEQRRNIFWVFYLMEKAISHSLGRPSVINDDDIAIELPRKRSGTIRSRCGSILYDIFQDQVTLAIIISRIYSELYSASAQTKSEVHRMQVLGKLDNHLQRWRDAIPIDIRPEHPIKCLDKQYVHVVMMHFAYLDAVILLHRLPGQQKSFENGGATDTKNYDKRLRLSPRVYASQLLCLAAARRSIQLLDAFSSNNLQNQNLMWKALYYPLSASLVLFANILSNPQDQNSASDIHLMNLMTSFITRSVLPGSSFATTPTLSLFKELYSIATRLVARVPQNSRQNMKRLPESNEDIESALISSSGVQLGSHRSFWSDSNTFYKYSQSDPQTPYESTLIYPETDKPESNLAQVCTSQQSQGDQDVRTNSNAERSQEFIDNKSLEFAPFMFSASSQFDCDLTIYDSVPSPTRFGWDMANMWMPSYAPYS